MLWFGSATSHKSKVCADEVGTDLVRLFFSITRKRCMICVIEINPLFGISRKYPFFGFGQKLSRLLIRVSHTNEFGSSRKL